MTANKKELNMLGLLLDAMSGMSVDESLERSGKAEQKDLADGKLPKDMGGEEESFRKLGFEIGAPIDECFVSAKFPEGWKVKPTDHYMHSDLLDAQDRKRGGIFFKPEFYDRHAHVSLNKRLHLNITQGEHLGDSKETLTVSFNDSAGQGFKVGAFKTISSYLFERGSYETKDKEYELVSQEYRQKHKDAYNAVYDFTTYLKHEAQKVFAKVFPENMDPAAYWNDDISAKTAELKDALEQMVEKITRTEAKTIAKLVPQKA